MDFTREPVVESVITPKEGCKLVVRSSKGAGQEEFFVDAVEVVSFGNVFFLRSLERPKSFLVPATDYEILEVRETRLVLKSVGIDRSIKIGGGKATPKAEEPTPQKEASSPKRRERRRPYKRRRAREEQKDDQTKIAPTESGKISEVEKENIPTGSFIRSLLPPPETLISESIERYRENQLFKDVFLPKEEEQPEEERAIEPEETNQI